MPAATAASTNRPAVLGRARKPRVGRSYCVLSEDPACRVALIEAGERPPEISALPIAPPAMQLNPATDWMYTADPGKAGLGLNGRRVPVPRCKMLGGSSGINYMMYVRGHPGDFDSWPKGAPPDGAKPRCCPISARATASRPTPRSSSTGRDHRPRRPAAHHDEIEFVGHVISPRARC